MTRAGCGAAPPSKTANTTPDVLAQPACVIILRSRCHRRRAFMLGVRRYIPEVSRLFVLSRTVSWVRTVTTYPPISILVVGLYPSILLSVRSYSVSRFPLRYII
ncbi:hypothetical protein K491DRAFT_315704 [Lophiostoma macrostomum CBS 122681]|uniref:Uncharacterized protein n=1 Tax=Lophiostoma macrostomum CBS 122681 TaxID=1314788 RepID=A0A6A6TFG7_9PLEO|nr:hypothetical protein K491DRAFT_315704 [Lophiostoma macrostomum CBS 122681]